MQTLTFEANATIIEEGAAVTHAFLVQAGAVMLTQHGTTTTLEAGATFAESAFWHPGGAADFSALAKEPTTLIALDANAWAALIGQCPPLASMFVRGMLEHMKRTPAPAAPVSRRAAAAAEKAQPAVTLSGVTRITMRSNGPELEKTLRGVVEILPSRLPYKIGGYPENGDINSTDNNNLYIPCRDNPLLISRQHCQLEVADDALVMLDLGSRFNTSVNGVMIGRGRGKYKLPLAMGENTIHFGDTTSRYSVVITVE